VPKVEFLEEIDSYPTNAVDDSEKFVFKEILVKILCRRSLRRSLCFIFEKNGESYVYKVHEIFQEFGEQFYTILLKCDKYRDGSKKLKLDIFKFLVQKVFC
jgi:hypothetical protein